MPICLVGNWVTPSLSWVITPWSMASRRASAMASAVKGLAGVSIAQFTDPDGNLIGLVKGM